MDKYNFGSAYEKEHIVFGASRPGFPDRVVPEISVQEWIDFMKSQGIKRICCLLPNVQLSYYEIDLLKTYDINFGESKVCWAPVEDYHLCDAKMLKERIIPFLIGADEEGERVVVHCSGGRGRAGQVLAAWIVYRHNLSVEQALLSVKNTGRDPFEAITSLNATKQQLFELLDM